MGCDTLLMVGSSFPYTQFMPAFDQARAVQIDLDPTMIGMRYPYEVNLVGDAATTLRALIPLLHRKADRTWRERIEDDVARWWETLDMPRAVDADPVNPMQLVPRAVAAAARRRDRHRRLRLGGELVRPPAVLPRRDARLAVGHLATMGPGCRTRIGAKFAHPDRPVVVFVGDGAMQMNGLAELITIARYWPEWSDPRLVVAVLHNNDLNQVTWEMRAMAGAPKFDESQALPDVDYAGFAAQLGLHGIRVDKPEEVGPALGPALAADRPAVLDVHSTRRCRRCRRTSRFDQVKALASARAARRRGRRGIVKQGVKTKLAGVPARREG